MSARRVLFIQPPRPATLTPVYLAFAAVAVVALAGFAFAWSARSPPPSEYRPSKEDAASSSRGKEPGALIPSRERDAPGRTRTL